MSDAIRAKWAEAQGKVDDGAAELAEADVEGCEEEEGDDDPIED